jgi:chitinase
VLRPEAGQHLAQLQALKAKNPNLKVILSVGGWGADNFSDAALTHTTRLQFTQSAIDTIRKYSLDGIDLDWEYPAQAGPGIKFRPEDKQNFTLLLAMLRERLDALSNERGRTGNDRYTLSIASSGDDEYFANTEMPKLHRYLDWINIMTYDMTGSWSKTTGHHAPLFRRASQGVSSARYVKQHLDAGIPPSKLVLGVPFYGKGWTEVNRAKRGLNQPAGCFLDSYSFSTLLREYVNHAGFRRHWDRRARNPYLWEPVSATWITYDDPESLRHKARFVKRNRLGGVMYWEHSHDPDEILLNTLYYSLR